MKDKKIIWFSIPCFVIGIALLVFGAYDLHRDLTPKEHVTWEPFPNNYKLWIFFK